MEQSDKLWLIEKLKLIQSIAKTPAHAEACKLVAEVAGLLQGEVDKFAGWTETTKRLPDYGIPVLIRVETKWGKETFAVAYRQPEECDDWDWIDDYFNMRITGRVTNWRPFDGPKID